MDVDVSTFCKTSNYTKPRYTALHWACHEGETDCVAVLLDCKANINDVDCAGWTALMLAVHVGCNEAAQLLIDTGANLLQVNNTGGTAYDLALEGSIQQELEGIEDGHFRALVDMLCDGLRDVDALTGLTEKQAREGISAQGSYILSLLNARTLVCPGIDTLGLNTYAYIQFSEDPGQNPAIVMSSCCLGNPNPEWNEIFQFQCDRLHPKTFLSIHFMGTLDSEMMGHLKEAKGVNDAANFAGDGLGVAVQTDSLVQVASVGQGSQAPVIAGENLPGGTGAAAPITIDEDGNVISGSMLEYERSLFAESGVEKTKGHLPDLYDRVWMRLKNFHSIVRRKGYETLGLPAVPRTHVPLGVIFISFRCLREALWSPGVYEYDRPLRLSQQARSRFDLEFRPRFWKPVGRVDASELSRYNILVSQEWSSSMVLSFPQFAARLFYVLVGMMLSYISKFIRCARTTSSYRHLCASFQHAV